MSAIFSPCGKFRYRLERKLGLFGPSVAVIMVNPSTADADTDDATIRRVVGFGKRFGWSEVFVGNVFAYRATDIQMLGRAVDPVGPENTKQLRSILSDSSLAVVAWGALGKLPPKLRTEWRTVVSIAEEVGVSLHCLGTAADGHPRHPLMLRKDTDLQEWLPPAH